MAIENSNELLIQNEIASNVHQAANIANGLRLQELQSDAEKLARANLYRNWRIAGEKSRVAFENAIEGKPAPAPLIPEALHGDSTLELLEANKE